MVFCGAAGQSSCDRKSGDWPCFKKFGMELRRVVGLHQIVAGNVTHNWVVVTLERSSS